MPRKSVGSTIEKKESRETITLHADNSIKTLWVDHTHLSIREDDLCMLRMSATLPEGLFEQAKIMTTKSHLRSLIDVLCKQLEYYPEPKEKKPNKL
ncbi:hypothetical protein [Desulfofustis limnaeus]|jgi:hypothetical protein|uniref:DUF3467 domain-containing protein n=1 Tax=Desulfofustis limnaeus TaxID=2740163 RepID=A0ABN6M521_9BACT|nr:hypothetical protein [Desulfofustis limnaeus]BDD87986.1 hypothetical protein DPPLL_23510 [Desulfofustis limnaeus]